MKLNENYYFLDNIECNKGFDKDKDDFRGLIDLRGVVVF